MAENATTFVTQEMVDRKDTCSEQVYSHPIAVGDIIKWAATCPGHAVVVLPSRG